MASTTLCLRHLPCKVLEEDIRVLMIRFGFDLSRYELSFPKKSGRQGRLNNFGYGFVTCSEWEDAEAFYRVFQNYRFEGIDSAKALQVEVSTSYHHVAAEDELSTPDGQSRPFAPPTAERSATEQVRSDRDPAASSSAASVGCGVHWRTPPEADQVPPTRLVSYRWQ
eukprot:TRINITY_DN9817_c2_g1_i1.p1 TRINITY_DN9817_c2_g1~~TRINITY_DN9817_c2_g1_i1.p1  ORF type:complete len:167 (+),score=20.81 TRINITY_DN9817_c2_g1_i1:65-565(+)